MLGLAWMGLLLSLLSCATCQRELTFRLGSVMETANDVPNCPGTGAMVQAFQLPVDRLNRGIGHGKDGLITKVTLRDRNGQEFRIKFDYVNRVPSACTPDVHNKEVERLIKQDKVHFLLGNTHFAFSEAKIANEAKKLTYHCCFETDELFKMDYPYIFGIANLADQETHQVLTSIALEDSIARLFVFYTTDFQYGTIACKNAVEYTSSKLKQISTKFELVKVLEYSTSNISSDPTFFNSVVTEEVLRSGATAVLGCDNTVNGFAVARALGRIKDRLKAIFLTLTPSVYGFAETVGPENAEYILTSASWHPKMFGQGDSFFGTPAQYADAYEAAFGNPPSFVPALASATVVSLIFALHNAFRGCEFLDPGNLDVERLLFDPSAIRCTIRTEIEAVSGPSITGYDAVLKSLSAQSMSLFLGNVEFNHFRRNIAHDPVVLQIQNGVPEIVLPLEEASRKLVMPIPHKEKQPRIGALEEDSFIIVVVVVLVGTLLLVAALAMVIFYRQKHARKMYSLLTIKPEQLEIINLPVQLDTTWESGKARLRNTLVALEPLTEIRMGSSLPGDSNVQGKSSPADVTKPRKSFLMKVKAPLSTAPSVNDSQELNSMISIDMDTEDNYIHVGSTEVGSAYQGSTSAGSVHQGSVLDGSDGNGRHTTATKPSLPTIQSMKMSHVPSPPSAPPAPKKERSRSNRLSQRQVLGLVWRYKNLQHPNVVPVAGVMWTLPGMHANIPVLVTECCELGSLSSVLDNQTMQLDFGKQLDITKDLADALVYLHAQDMNLHRPALLSKLSGVLLNKHFRAKLRVPLTSLISMHSDSDAHHHHPVPRRSKPQDCNCLELQDVFQFGRGITQLHTVSTGFSSSSVLDEPEQTLEGSAMTVGTYSELERTRGHGLAVLLRECCSIDCNLRPTFTQIVERLEALESEIMQAAQHDSQQPLVSLPHNPRSLSRPISKGQGADSLLYELFPAKVAEALKSGRSPDPEPYPSISLFFSDVVGYTALCSKLAPEEIMDMLHRLYSRFDTLAQSLKLFKVETIGDAYMCASNLLHPAPDTHAAKMATFAFSACAAANQVPVCESYPELGNIHIRVGIHAGPVMGAVVGILNRRFCLFGDTVNVASRMESTSVKDSIQCSAFFMDLLQQQWPEAARLAAPQGLKPIKGKGTMHTFFLYPPPHAP